MNGPMIIDGINEHTTAVVNGIDLSQIINALLTANGNISSLINSKGINSAIGVGTIRGSTSAQSVFGRGIAYFSSISETVPSLYLTTLMVDGKSLGATGTNNHGMLMAIGFTKSISFTGNGTCCYVLY